MKKYELTNITKSVNNRILFRIRALRDFGLIKKGDLGGWIEKESNLSQKGDCWISGNAQIFRNAKIYGDAQVYGNAQIYDSARIYENARIYDSAEIFGNARVFGDSQVYDIVRVYDTAWVHGTSRAFGQASIRGNAIIHGYALVYGNAEVHGDSICTKSPLVLNGLTIHRITSTDNMINIGCLSLTLEEWLKDYEKIGKRHGYSKKDIEIYKNALKFLKNTKKYF